MQILHRKMTLADWIAVLGIALLGAAIAGSARARERTLLNVSYDPTRELYEDYNALFAKHWQETQGEAVDDPAVPRRLGQAGARRRRRPRGRRRDPRALGRREPALRAAAA